MNRHAFYCLAYQLGIHVTARPYWRHLRCEHPRQRYAGRSDLMPCAYPGCGVLGRYLRVPNYLPTITAAPLGDTRVTFALQVVEYERLRVGDRWTWVPTTTTPPQG